MSDCSDILCDTFLFEDYTAHVDQRLEDGISKQQWRQDEWGLLKSPTHNTATVAVLPRLSCQALLGPTSAHAVPFSPIEGRPGGVLVGFNPLFVITPVWMLLVCHCWMVLILPTQWGCPRDRACVGGCQSGPTT